MDFSHAGLLLFQYRSRINAMTFSGRSRQNGPGQAQALMQRILGWSAVAAMRMLTERTRDPTEKPLGTLSIHWTQLLLQPGPSHKISELWRQAGSVIRRFAG